MKKNTILLICLTTALAALGGAAALLLLTRPEPPPPKEAASMVPIYEFAAPVRSVELTAAGKAPFIVLNTGDGEYQPENAGGAGDAVIAGLEGFGLIPAKVSTLFMRAKGLSAAELLFEEAGDRAVFELAPPRVRVKAVAMDGEEAVFLIGKEAPGGAGYYLSLEGRPEIYLVPSLVLDYFFLQPEELINLTVTSSEKAASDFDRLALSGSTCGTPDGRIVVEAVGDERIRMITFPVLHRVDYQILTALQNIFQLDASGIAAISPAPEDLDALGFDEPYAVVEALIGEESFTLRYTRPDERGETYVMRDGVPLLYTVASADTRWMGKNYFDMMEKYAFEPDIRDVRELVIETPDSADTFTLTYDDSRLTVTLNGVREVGVGDFRAFFQTLGRVSYEEGPGQPGGFPDSGSFDKAPSLRFIYRFADGGEQTVSFYKGPLRRDYLYVGDGPGYLVSSLSAERVLQELARLVTVMDHRS